MFLNLLNDCVPKNLLDPHFQTVWAGKGVGSFPQTGLYQMGEDQARSRMKEGLQLVGKPPQ
jgi:hypothetical protein